MNGTEREEIMKRGNHEVIISIDENAELVVSLVYCSAPIFVK